MKGYQFFDHTADVLFEAYGKTKEEMFTHAAQALTELQIEPSSIEATKEKTFSVKAKNLEMLLFNFLEELIFIKDAESLILKEFHITIQENTLTCLARGEETNVDKHEMKVDAKAITMHQFEVKEIEGGWMCRVIVDI